MAQFTGPQTYIVRQGDYLEKIAYTLGFDGDTVWSHEKNAELRQRRKDKHHILLPGDTLYIPALNPPPEHDLTAGTENHYVATVPERPIVLALCDDKGPLPNEDYVLEGLGDPITGKSDDEGKVSFAVPLTTREVRLVLPLRGAFMLGIGDLDPISEITGVQMRLASHGLYCGAPTGEIDDDTRDGILRFQRDNNLEMSGELTPETLDALEKFHGR